jgi:hypothetical protein
VASLLKLGIAFAGGIAVGLLLARTYAKDQVDAKVHSAFAAVGLGGGALEQTATGLVEQEVLN